MSKGFNISVPRYCIEEFNYVHDAGVEAILRNQVARATKLAIRAAATVLRHNAGYP